MKWKVMSKSPDDILVDALALPASQRARLAQELLQSLDERKDPDAAAKWLEEIERRAREVEDGTAVLEDWETVRDRLKARWRAR